jgi:ribose transport system substrate-binding protein
VKLNITKIIKFGNTFIVMLLLSTNNTLAVDSKHENNDLNSFEELSAKNGSFESTGNEVYSVLLSAVDWVFDGAASTIGVMVNPAELGFPAAVDGNKALYIGVDYVNGAVTSGKAFQDLGQSSVGMIYTVTAQVNRGHLYDIGYKLSLRDAVNDTELASTTNLGKVSFSYKETTARTLRLQVETYGTISPTAALRTSIDNIVVRQQNAKDFNSAIVINEEKTPFDSHAKQGTATSNAGLPTSADYVVIKQHDPARTKDFIFAVVGKEENSPFYLQVKQGCLAAAKKLAKVKCIYRGPERRDVRLQSFIIEELVDDKVDAIAVSVTQSKWLTSHGLLKAKEAGIPVITFNSDIDLAYESENLRLAYIGSDNFEIGKAMGIALKKLKPQGGKVIILSGREDATNLNQRILGVRQTLVGENDTASLSRMLGDLKGWSEIRTPYYSYGRPDMANAQFSKMLSPTYSATALISVGGWPQFNSDSYREMVKPYEIKIRNKEVLIVVAGTEANQITLLEDSLSHINVGQTPYDMGLEAINTLYKIVMNKPYEKIVITPLTFCNNENYATCTSNLYNAVDYPRQGGVLDTK